MTLGEAGRAEEGGGGSDVEFDLGKVGEEEPAEAERIAALALVRCPGGGGRPGEEEVGAELATCCTVTTVREERFDAPGEEEITAEGRDISIDLRPLPGIATAAEG